MKEKTNRDNHQVELKLNIWKHYNSIMWRPRRCERNYRRSQYILIPSISADIIINISIFSSSSALFPWSRRVNTFLISLQYLEPFVRNQNKQTEENNTHNSEQKQSKWTRWDGTGEKEMERLKRYQFGSVEWSWSTKYVHFAEGRQRGWIKGGRKWKK